MSDEVVLEELRAGLAAGGRLDDEQLRVLASTTDLFLLGTLADDVRRARHSEATTFVRVAKVPVQRPAWREIKGQAREIRVTGVPESPEEAEAAVRVVAGAGVPVTGFALHDLLAVSGGDTAALERSLTGLRAAGLSAVSELVVERTPNPEPAVSAVVAAGLAVARVTIHEACGDARLGCVRAVAGWSLPARAVWAFAPLPRADAAAEPGAELPTGYDDVRQVALARLLVDNIDSIQVDWALHGAKLAQVALMFGADDIDALPVVDTGKLGPRRTPLEEVRRNIRAASFVPVERDGCFEDVTR